MRTHAPHARAAQSQAPQRSPATASALPGRVAAAPRIAAKVLPAGGFDFGRISVQPQGVQSGVQAQAVQRLAVQSQGVQFRPAENALHRRAAGPGPATAPDIVHQVVREPGRPMPQSLQRDMTARLGHDVGNVRLHTDRRAGASAQAVAADAYTVGRHIVFAPGRFAPESPQGRQLVAHELTHALAHPASAPTPSGELRVSKPTETAERHAVSVEQGGVRPGIAREAVAKLFRKTAGPVALTGTSLNFPRVTVPPEAGLALKATKSPPNAADVAFSLAGDTAAISARTTIDSATGAVNVGDDQTGGSAHVRSDQASTGNWRTAPVNFAAIPTGIAGTTASARNKTGQYGGDFLHSFAAPPPGPGALHRAHVNEHFAGASGTALPLKGKLGTLSVTVNAANSPSAGWDLDASGTMAGPDHVTWGNRIDARPFVANASNPTAADVLPQDLSATQEFRNLGLPSKKYGATVATTTHRRAIEDHGGKLTAVTSAGVAASVEDVYAGPTVFRRASATPAAVPVATPAPKGGKASPATTARISVDAEGRPAKPHYTINKPDLGCHISGSGVLTPGTIAGTVTIRAGDSGNYDEATVALTALPAPAVPGATPAAPPAVPTAVTGPVAPSAAAPAAKPGATATPAAAPKP